ncbi:MAG: SGNH/GDSL hydrolase family protein [Lachnospiraceae bacterium]|nr:SGNH/GDSL hydrolase family protein [Lachnospiraceae bacterium]
MKKRGTTIGILLSAAGILLLLGLGVYLTLDWKNTIAGGNSAPAQKTEDASIPSDGSGSAGDGSASDQKTGTDPQTAAALAALQAADAPLPQHHIIFVGDSRTVGMGEAETDDTCTYIGAVGEGYHWFADTGMAQMEAAMEQYPADPVVLNLGVNDMDMIDSYLELYKTFAKTYPETRFYFMSVNPVTEKAAHVTNEEIADFNSKLRAAFPEAYLDCNTYLRIKEFESADGVHYSRETYRTIHDFAVKKCLQHLNSPAPHS